MSKEYDGTYEIDVSGYTLSRANAKIVGHVCKLNVCGRNKMTKKISAKLQDALWRAQNYLEEPEGPAEEWTTAQVGYNYKAKDSLDALIQAAQDEVWELIEKVLNHNLTECIDTIEFVDPPQVQKGITLNCKEGGLNYRIAKWTFREAILEAAKELEIE